MREPTKPMSVGRMCNWQPMDAKLRKCVLVAEMPHKITCSRSMIPAFPRAGGVMKKLVVAAAAGAPGVVSGARAAGMPTKAPVMAAPTPVFSWTGFYLGVQGGAAWSNSTIDEQASFGNNNFNAANYSIKARSGEVGIYGGYNYQFSQGFIGWQSRL